MVDITVTGEVERCIETSRSFAVTLKVDDGGKFPKRLTIWTNQKLEQGATVVIADLDAGECERRSADLERLGAGRRGPFGAARFRGEYTD